MLIHRVNPVYQPAYYSIQIKLKKQALKQSDKYLTTSLLFCYENLSLRAYVFCNVHSDKLMVGIRKRV